YVDLRKQIAELKSQGVTPGIAVALIGDDPASRAYVRSKDKMSRELGLHSVKLELPVSTSQSELLARVEELNRDPQVHGILAHSPTKNLEEVTRSADILIAAIGRAHFVKAGHVREGAVVIDVGINRVEDKTNERGYRLVGDVAFDEVAAKAKAITPVPGGVGPMTIAMLMSNTVKAAQMFSGT